MLPDRASFVIVGAGAIGCSIAMQLARLGARGVVVIEKSGVTHGSTWHAAGLVGQYRSRPDLAAMMRDSVAVMDELAARRPIDWRRVGSLRLASSPARMAEFRDAAPIARRYGIGFDLLTPQDARNRFPLIDTTGLAGAAFVHGDGYVDPTSLTMAYAAEAKAGGVAIVEGVCVTGVERTGDRIVALVTDKGRIACEHLVIAAGVWARPLGALCGVDIPVAALSHQYAVTEKRGDIAPGLPALRDPDLDLYVKPEAGALAIGGWEPATVPAADGDLVFSFGRELLPDDLDRLAPILENAARRIPAVAELGLRTIINGPIPVTPDGEPILGPAPGLDNAFLAVGFTSGIAASGGAGFAAARWLMEGRPATPLPSLDPLRFGRAPIPLPELNRHAIAAYAAYYALSTTQPVDFAAPAVSS
jgi:4-methylaminobutanoate oxidase (formaldehyde-forming)